MLAALLYLLAGCAADPFRGLDPSVHGRSVELTSTPFFPQEEFQCGPAALAMILQAAGVDAQPDELVARVYTPGRRGSLHPELLAASRAFGLVPYVLQPRFPALLAELDAGRPVLVLQNLGIAALPSWHFAVAIGYSARDSHLVLRSGKEKRRITRAGLFLKTWDRGGHWAMVLLQPGELPAADDPGGYLESVAAFESTGQYDIAAQAYEAALQRWPGNGLALLGRGNVALAAGRADEAEHWYRQALQDSQVAPVILNNLAVVVASQGRCAEASRLIERALATDVQPATLALLEETRAELVACGTGQP